MFHFNLAHFSLAHLHLALLGHFNLEILI